MLHPIGYVPDELPPFKRRPGSTSGWSLFEIVICCLLAVFLVILVVITVPAAVLFIAGHAVYSWACRLFQRKPESEIPEAADDEEDEDGESLICESQFEKETAWLKIKMNRRAFVLFVGELANVFFERKFMKVVDCRGVRHMGETRFHVHCSDIFPALEGHEIYFTARDGPFEVTGGQCLSASVEVWQKAIREWRDTIEYIPIIENID